MRNMNNETIPWKYLVSIDSNTNTVEERYTSGKDAVKWNEGYNYNCLMNAINKGIKYKGYYWKWIYCYSNDNPDIDTEFREEIRRTIEAIKSIRSKIK